jgi:ATP-binding cassette, subfamily B, bacterial
VISLVWMFTLMWQLDRQLLLLAVVAVLPLLIVIKFFTGPITERTSQQERLAGEMMAVAEQTLMALPVVQAFNREELQDKRLRDLSHQSICAYMRTTKSQLKFKIGAGTITSFGTAMILVIGGVHVLQGSLTVGSLLIFLSYLSSLYAPIETLSYTQGSIISAAVAGKRVLEVLEAEDSVRESPQARALPKFSRGERGHVRLDGISFGYEPGCPVLQGVSLEARPGEITAIVGPTGSGKSTLVSLIPRFFDPWSGRVEYDGVDLRDVRLSDLRAHISIVLQEPILLPLTVAENIAYGRPAASKTEIVAAAEAANADVFIRYLPQGYDTIISERGATLSGGERQRLAIARALLKDAPVLILDEPTSALDAQTEKLLLEALQRLMSGRTTFLVAHRLSTVRRADRIVVLKRGRVVEAGSHDELLNREGLYARFHKIQFGTSTVAEKIESR